MFSGNYLISPVVPIRGLFAPRLALCYKLVACRPRPGLVVGFLGTIGFATPLGAFWESTSSAVVLFISYLGNPLYLND